MAACTCCNPHQLRRAATGNARALCSARIPADGLTITHGAAWALCLACVIGIPTDVPDPAPRGTAP
ncbi:MAG: hypothetical protein ACRDTD_14845 [Pseudonocardiaceae bacterium]